MPAVGEEGVALTIGELAAMSGVSTDTIRAWERRHGALEPARTHSHHRRYRMEDVEIVRRVRHNVSSRGMSLKVAVAEARGLVVPDAMTEPDVPPTPIDPGGGDEAPWRAVVDLLPNVICIVDGDGQIVDANIAFARMAGALRMHLRGMRFLDLVAAQDRAKAARLYRPRPQRRRGWELNLRTSTLAGIFTFDSHVVRSSGGDVLVLMGWDLSSAGVDLWPAAEAALPTRLTTPTIPSSV